MPRKMHRPEEIVAKLRQVELLVGQGKAAVEAVRAIGVTEATYWRAAGFRLVGHLAFTKPYASRSGFLRASHEAAYLLAKGEPPAPPRPPADVLSWRYTGNRLHPTQKPLEVLSPLIEALCPPGGMVLDPFCGSGSTLLAARELGRDWLGIELEERHWRTAHQRMAHRGG